MTAVSWRLGRAASRAAVGSIAGIVFAFAWYAVQQDMKGYAVKPEEFLPQLIKLGAWIAFITVAIVTVAESKVSALRLPDGDVYRIVGGNRFAAAAILGVVVALTVGLFEYAISSDLDQFGFQVLLTFAVGFVIAEAVVGRRFTGSPKNDVSAPSNGSTLPWSLGRTAARTAIGSIVGSVAAFALNAVVQALRGSPVEAGDYVQLLIAVGGAITFVSVAIVTVAESQVPRLRLPDGDVYQIVGGNRFAASAVLGAIVSVVIGLPVLKLNHLDYNPGVALISAVGFVIAEALVGRRFGSAKRDAAAA